MNSSATVRIAVVGAGVIGRRHVEAIANAEGTELAAIVDVDPGAEALARDSAVPWFEGVATMCEQLKVDGVVISTPTIHHLKPALDALDAGCHVFVEKPITATMEEAQTLVQRSADTGCHVLVGHQRRYYALVEKTRQLIASGELGDLVAINGQWTVKKVDDYYDPGWRKERAAGPVLTNLIHEIDYLRYMCGDIASISAEVSNGVMGYEKEDVAAVVLRFKSGALGTFLLSDQASSPWAWELATGENPFFPPTGENCIRFMGTKGSLDFPNLTLWHHGGAVTSWNHLIESETLTQPFEDAYLLQCQHFKAVICGVEQPRIDAADGARTLEATLAVLDAAERGERVVLA